MSVQHRQHVGCDFKMESWLNNGSKGSNSRRTTGGMDGRTHLMGDIGSGVTDIAIHLAHDTDVLVAVKQRVLVLPLHPHAASAATTIGSLVCLEAGI